MKTSLLLIVALILNTTLLLAGPISELLKSTAVWPFVILEVLLFLGCYLHLTMRNFRKATKPDFTDLDIFVIRGNKDIEKDHSS